MDTDHSKTSLTPNASEAFDLLTRSFGSGLPRRQAFGIFFKGIIGVALAQIGIHNTWAVDTCLCNGSVYDPTTACCTPSGVRVKYPIAKTSDCPGKVPHPGYVARFDGCGSKASVFNPNRVPQGWGGADFSQCCNSHDVCYGTCNREKGNDCDSPFFDCLSTACAAAYPLDSITHALLNHQLYEQCLNAATTYYAAVSLGGAGPFEAAQAHACDCCSESTCPNSCAGSSCGSLPACVGGGDCVCFTSTESTGACIHGNTPCAGIQSCSSTANCPPGYACVATSCCGSTGVCGPLCNVIGPATKTVLLKTSIQTQGPTLGGT
jgi:hypothetical protein